MRADSVPLSGAIEDQELLLDEHRLGNYRTNAAGTGDSSNGRDEMDEKDDEIPHLRMLAKLENARNWAHFSNSPPTGWKSGGASL